MGYGTGGITKLEYAACLAAAIAWLVSGQRDAVGLTTFDERIVDAAAAAREVGAAAQHPDRAGAVEGRREVGRGEAACVSSRTR